MPKSKTQKRLEALEKLENQYEEEARNTSVDFPYFNIPYRQTMLLTQINNLRSKLHRSPYGKQN